MAARSSPDKPVFGASRSRPNFDQQIGLEGRSMPEDLFGCPSRKAAGLPRQLNGGGEDVLVVYHAVLGERVDVARVGPDRVRLGAAVDRQPTVVAVEARLDAIRRREFGRQDREAEWRAAPVVPREQIVQVVPSRPRTGGLWTVWCRRGRDWRAREDLLGVPVGSVVGAGLALAPAVPC